MPLLTLTQVAAELGLKSVQSVRNLAARGELVILKLAGVGSRIDSKDLEDLLRRMRAAGSGKKCARPARPGGLPKTRFQDAVEIREWAARLVENPDTPTNKVIAANHCLTLFYALAETRERLARVTDERERERKKARSGLMRRARSVGPDQVPPALRDLCGRLIDYPVPTTGQGFVYFLIDGEEVVYVGKSISIESRVAGHVAAGKNFNRVLVMPVVESKLAATER